MRSWWKGFSPILLVLMFSVMFSAPVGAYSGDVVEFFDTVAIGAGQVVNGDVVSIIGDILIDGEVRTDAVAVFGDVVVNGRVLGDVVSVGGDVTLGTDADILGDVTTVGGHTVHQTPGSQIHGQLNSVGFGDVFDRVHISVAPLWIPAVPALFAFSGHTLFGYIFYLAGLYGLALLTLSLFPRHTRNVAETIEKQLGRSALVGVVLAVAAVPATVFLAVTVIGIPIIPLLWLAVVAAKMLGYTAFVFLVGDLIGKRNQSTLSPPAQLAVGVLILGFVRYIPMLGALASLAVTLVTLGAVFDSRFGTNRRWFPPKNVDV